MNEVHVSIYNELYEYARLRTTCLNDFNSIMLKSESGNTMLHCGCDYEVNCKLINETCPSSNCNINSVQYVLRELIEKTEANTRVRNKFDRKTDTLYILEFLNEKDANYIVEKGFKKVVYYGGLFSKRVEEIFASSDVNFTHIVGLVGKDTWWSDQLFEEAYDIVKDRKIPLTIPGYNRPELPVLERLKFYEMDEELNWPVIVFVRESQKAEYVEATQKYKYVTIHDFPDELISNAGAVRRMSQRWLYKQGYPLAFQMDDDVNNLTYTHEGMKADGYPKSQYVTPMKGKPVAKVLAMWQIAMERAVASDNVMISGGMPIAFCWKDGYCESVKSYSLSRGSLTQVFCLNITGMCENNLFYNDNKDCGLDDIDMTVRVLDRGFNVCTFSWLVYGCDAMGAPGQPFEQIQDRFRSHQEKLKEIHGEKPWLSFREKRNLPQCCITWKAVRRMQKENGYRSVDQYEFNIWEDGKLLDQARNNSYTHVEV